MMNALSTSGAPPAGEAPEASTPRPRDFRLPDPILRRVDNFSPFPHFKFQKMGKGRIYYDCIALKATYDLSAGTLAPSTEQAPIVLSDEYHDESPELSSLSRVGELHLPKAGTDVVLTGDAEAPGGVPTARWTCEVIVRRSATVVLRHTVSVTGPRHWQRGVLGGWELTDPARVKHVPIRYELAYGGHFAKDAPAGTPDDDNLQIHHENPSGIGLYSARDLDGTSPLPAPQWELLAHPIKTPNRDTPLAGFGPVARMWAARRRHGGTYDAAWHAQFDQSLEEGVAPDYPPDFDSRYFHAAHPALCSTEPLGGDERIELGGFLAAQPALGFDLPGLRPQVDILPRSGPWARRPMALDLVHLDLEARKVYLVWRVAFDPVEQVLAAGVHLDATSPKWKGEA